MDDVNFAAKGAVHFLASSKRRLDLPVIKTFLISATLAALVSLSSQAAEIIPPKPAGYFNDYAGVVSKAAALRFNEQLAQFERETSNQVVVAVFPKMQSDSSVDDYTQRVAQSWGVGQKDKRNGAVLFVFIEDRKMLICKAIRGEYKGSGKTVAEKRGKASAPNFLFFIIFIIVLIVISRVVRRLGGYGYSSGRGGPVFFPMGGGGGGWSSGGGGSSGFGGGGGSFGGGGAGSSW